MYDGIGWYMMEGESKRIFCQMLMTPSGEKILHGWTLWTGWFVIQDETKLTFLENE